MFHRALQPWLKPDPGEEHPGPVAMAGEDQGASPEAKVKTKEPPAETMDDLAMETKRTEKKVKGWVHNGSHGVKRFTHKKLGLKELRKRYGDLAIQNLVNIYYIYRLINAGWVPASIHCHKWTCNADTRPRKHHFFGAG